MDAVERLILAGQAGLFAWPAGPVLLVGARPGPALSQLDAPLLTCVQPGKGPHDALLRAGYACRPDLPEPSPEGFAAALLLATRARVETLGRVAALTRLTRPGGLVAVSGAKTDGIDTLAGTLRDLLGAERYAKGHGKVVAFTRPDTLSEDMASRLASFEAAARPAPNAQGYVTAPGMFSPAQADPGSQLLAQTLAGRLSGKVAELGAGYGWLAAQLLQTNPDMTELGLFEADHASLAAARANVTDPRAAFHWADATALPAPQTRVDHVVSNPPFHDGRAADPTLGQAFIAAAARLLTPKGRLTLVANRQLPYEAALAAQFIEVEPPMVSGGYKILAAARPRRKPR
ncbi:MAG: methyltransferase [Pseudomonadota bacterium]